MEKTIPDMQTELNLALLSYQDFLGRKLKSSEADVYRIAFLEGATCAFKVAQDIFRS